MRGFDRAADLDHDFGRGQRVERSAARQTLRERATRHVVHHDVRTTPGRDPGIKHGHDVRVIGQAADGPTLSLEPTRGFVLEAGCVQQLHGHVPIEGKLTCTKDAAETAFAEWSHDLVTLDPELRGARQEVL